MGDAMVRPLTSLTLNSLILHQVPRAKRNAEDAEPLTLSKAPVRLGNDQRLYMQERLRSSLSANKPAREVQEASGHTSPVPDLLRNLLQKPTRDFVKDSQKMAEHLREVQDGSSPNGLFLFARCTWATHPAVLVAKVELEKGIQVEQIEDKDGLATYDMTLLKNLVFGQTSKIYKVGLFSAADLSLKTDRLTGLAIDEQIGGAGVTKLFLLHYLGCEYVANAAEQTRVFYEKASEFFTHSVSDPATKAKYLVALVSELASRKPNLNVKEFARDHLDDEHQQLFQNHLGNAGVPFGDFTKSIDFVATHLVRYETDTDVIIIADREQAKKGTIVVSKSSVLVKGGLKKVGTHGRKGNDKESGVEEKKKRRKIVRSTKFGDAG